MFPIDIMTRICRNVAKLPKYIVVNIHQNQRKVISLLVSVQKLSVQLDNILCTYSDFCFMFCAFLVKGCNTVYLQIAHVLEETCSSEMLGCLQSTQRYNPEDHSHSCENLKSDKIIYD